MDVRVWGRQLDQITVYCMDSKLLGYESSQNCSNQWSELQTLE